jgi:membrane protease YdiL (CAAX protease family)
MVQGACHAPPAEPRRRDVLAPPWHLALLVFLICLVAAGGLLGIAPAAADPEGSRLVGSYLPLSVAAGSLALYVSFPRFGASIFPALWGARPRAEVVRDVFVAGMLVAAVLGAEHLLTRGASEARSPLLPATVGERYAWLLVAALVAWSEELVYRGYLRRQLAAYAASWWLGNVAQAVLFGVAHLEQGVDAAARIGAYGLLFGVAAQRRRHLLPSVLAHVALNWYAGLSG